MVIEEITYRKIIRVSIYTEFIVHSIWKFIKILSTVKFVRNDTRPYRFMIFTVTDRRCRTACARSRTPSARFFLEGGGVRHEPSTSRPRFDNVGRGHRKNPR